VDARPPATGETPVSVSRQDGGSPYGRNGQDARFPSEDDIDKSLSFFAADGNAILMCVCTNMEQGS